MIDALGKSDGYGLMPADHAPPRAATHTNQYLSAVMRRVFAFAAPALLDGGQSLWCYGRPGGWAQGARPSGRSKVLRVSIDHLPPWCRDSCRQEWAAGGVRLPGSR